MSKAKFTATVVDPERRAFVISIFGSDTVPIESIMPINISTFEHEQVLAYMLDLDAITDEQLEKLITALAGKFGYDVDFVRSEIARQGVPLLTDDVGVLVQTSDYGTLMDLLADDLESAYDRDYDPAFNDSLYPASEFWEPGEPDV